ncbi:MAG: hypothetical protein ACREGA_01170 [Candidatus Saccharimonadales bacterium]
MSIDTYKYTVNDLESLTRGAVVSDDPKIMGRVLVEATGALLINSSATPEDAEQYNRIIAASSQWLASRIMGESVLVDPILSGQQR